MVCVVDVLFCFFVFLARGYGVCVSCILFFLRADMVWVGMLCVCRVSFHFFFLTSGYCVCMCHVYIVGRPIDYAEHKLSINVITEFF